jgi:hypothetical protein
MSGADNTETNAILAGGLAIVGLLGVAGTLLPPGMLPGGATGSTEMSSSAVVESSPEQHADTVTAELPAEAEAGEQPVFKPVELQSISDVDPVPVPDQKPSASTAAKAADAMSPMMEMPVEVQKAVEKAFVAGEQVSAPETAKPGAAEEVAAEATSSPVEQAEQQSGQTAPEPVAQSQPAGASISDEQRPAPTSRRPVPAWNSWQNRAYQPPPAPQPYATPQPFQPYYPPQPYGYPQWVAPQR